MANTPSPEIELQPTDVVGDDRRLQILSVSPGTGDDFAVVGEVWQDEDGSLRGSGMAAVMLFEPVSMAKYQMSSISADISPLAVFYARIARTPFLRAEVLED